MQSQIYKDISIIMQKDEITKRDFVYSPKMGNFDLVVRYRRAGINVMPLKTDGSKAPKISWKSWQSERVPAWLIREHFSDNPRRPSGIGLICGATSGNLEVLDFDAPELFEPWCRLVGDISKFPIIETPSGGRHLIWRCPKIQGNVGLAWDEDGDIMIETRGQGGQAVLPGSPPETHRTGKPYRLMAGSLEDMPTITSEERTRLLEAARGFNKKPGKGTMRVGETAKKKYNLKELYGDDFDDDMKQKGGDRPGDDFNARATWGEILEPKGWEFVKSSGGADLWLRPDNGGTCPDNSHSASTGHCGDNLHVFSTSADPFEAGKTYSKFAAYAMLNHEGDFGRAARFLAEEGYGTSSELATYHENIKQIFKGKADERPQ